jgi:hypothetical protein
LNAIKPIFFGLDGCKTGWFYIGIDEAVTAMQYPRLSMLPDHPNLNHLQAKRPLPIFSAKQSLHTGIFSSQAICSWASLSGKI